MHKAHCYYSYLLPIFVLLVACQSPGNKKHIDSKKQYSALVKDTGNIRNLLRASDRANDAEQRITRIRKALRQSLDVHYNDGIVESVFYITAFFFEKGAFDSCSRYYQLAYLYARHPNFRRDLLPTLYLNHGTFYYLQGNYVAADSLYYLGLHAANEADVPIQRFYILYNLHYTKRLIGQKRDALNYLDEAKKLSVSLHDSDYQRMALVAESEFYFEEKEITKASASLEKSFEVHRGDTTADQWNSYANVLAAGNRPQEAVPILKRAIVEARRGGIDFLRLNLSTRLGTVYNQMGQYKQAIAVLEPVIKETLEKKFNYNTSDIYTALKFAYEHSGDYKKALEVDKHLNAVNDSLLNIDKIKSLNELDVKYKTAEKDKLIALGKLKIADQTSRINQQAKWIGLVSAAAILVMVLFIAYYRLKKQQIVYLKQQQELDKLKAKIQGEENERQRLARELHDGVGGLLSSALMHANQLEIGSRESETLNSIKSMVAAAAIELKKSANNLVPEPVEKLGLAEAIRQFCSGMKTPFSVDTTVQVYGELNSLDLPLQLTIYRMVQELVHNAMKHASANKILVQVIRSAQMIEITVEDDGKGIDTKPAQGMGLKNLYSRVQELRGKFSIVTEADDGTAINIELPLSY